MRMPPLHRLAIGLLLTGLALRLWIAWAPFDPWQLSYGPLVDDSFYYFQIAKNIALGLGPTHDGIVVTSGFQPLWAFMLVPLWQLTDDPVLPIHVAMTFCAVLGTVTGWGIWWLVRHLAGEVGAVFALGLWCLSPYVLQHTMNGMETGLAACLLVWTALYYSTQIRPGSAGTRAWATFGVLGGLCYLARVDNAIFLAALGLDGVLRLGPRNALRGGSLAAVLAVVISSPWILWCWSLGSALPESGPAIRQLSQLYATLSAYSAHAFGSLWFCFDNLVILGRHVLSQPLVPLPALPVGYVLQEWMPGTAATWVTIATYAVLFGLVHFGPWRSVLRPGRFPSFLCVWAGLLLLAYATAVPGQWFYDRYTFGLTTFGLVLAGVVVHGIHETLGRRAFTTYMTVSLLAITGAFAHQSVRVFGTTGGKNVVGYYDLARVLRESPEFPEPIAVIQSGVVGYFAQKKFIALDGKVNSEAARALRERKLFTYLESQSARFVVDSYPWLVELLLRECSQNEARPALRQGPLEFEGNPVGLGVFIQR